MKRNKLYLGDCFEIMKTFPDSSVDMVLVDLPYGTTACKWDSVLPIERLWAEYKRLCPTGALVFTASQPFTSALVMSNVKHFKHEWIWRKAFGSNFASVKYAPFKEHESVLVFCFNKKAMAYYPIMEERRGSGKKAAGKLRKNPSNTGKRECYNGFIDKQTNIVTPELRNPSSVQEFTNERGLHPTQKPVTLFEYMIKTFTKPGALVLDNCIGSGTTAIAAMNSGRHWIGIEMDETYYKKALERIANYTPEGTE